jgi:hypothetical protein
MFINMFSGKNNSFMSSVQRHISIHRTSFLQRLDNFFSQKLVFKHSMTRTPDLHANFLAFKNFFIMHFSE